VTSQIVEIEMFVKKLCGINNYKKIVQNLSDSRFTEMFFFSNFVMPQMNKFFFGHFVTSQIVETLDTP
jgi:hypothetical protein